MIIWEHSPIPKVDLLYFHSISRIGCLSIVDLLCLLILQVRIGLIRNLRLLRWSRMSEIWLSLGWR